MKALQSYGQDYASNEYQNFINRYYQSMEPDKFLTSVGQSAAALTGNQAMSAGSNISNLYQQQGQTNANAQMGLASIYSSLGNSLSGIAMNRGETIANNYMNQGNIAAQSTMNQANAWTGAINNGLSTYGLWSGMQQPSVTPTASLSPSYSSPAYSGSLGNYQNISSQFYGPIVF